MELHFSKYHGAGNDFVMVDGRQYPQLKGDVATIRLLCDRHFGIGSDGLILLLQDERSDFYMDFYNPDGSQSLCGNGARAAVAFASELALVNDAEASFFAIDGAHQGFVLDQGQVKVSMPAVAKVEARGTDFFVNTGSPHHVQWAEDLEQVDVATAGAAIRHRQEYAPGGTNVNFVQRLGDGSLAIRTFERGVEAETLACGTGITAVALVAAHQGAQSPVAVQAQGGSLRVHFRRGNNGFEDIWLEGPAVKVFEGTFFLP